MDVPGTDDDGVTRQICSQMLVIVESRGQVTSQQASSSDAVRNAQKAVGTRTGPGRH